jgi:hypothetical protein
MLTGNQLPQCPDGCLCCSAFKCKTESRPQYDLSPQSTHLTGNRSIKQWGASERRNLDGRMCRLPQAEHCKISPPNVSVLAAWDRLESQSNEGTRAGDWRNDAVSVAGMILDRIVR